MTHTWWRKLKVCFVLRAVECVKSQEKTVGQLSSFSGIDNRDSEKALFHIFTSSCW